MAFVCAIVNMYSQRKEAICLILTELDHAERVQKLVEGRVTARANQPRMTITRHHKEVWALGDKVVQEVVADRVVVAVETAPKYHA